jgi:hypothetical protein
MQYNRDLPLRAMGNEHDDCAQLDDLPAHPRRTTELNLNQEPERYAMANKDQKKRSTNNKPKLSVKEKKERKERKAAAKQRDR